MPILSHLRFMPRHVLQTDTFLCDSKKQLYLFQNKLFHQFFSGVFLEIATACYCELQNQNIRHSIIYLSVS